jgi:5-methylcytosine-specific restriction endonuclease McrA
MRTLVLNSGFEPMQLISWQRAICLVLTQKAEVLAEYENKIRTVSTSFSMPSVVKLKRYVQVVYSLGIIRCSRKNVLIRDKYNCQYCGVQCRPHTVTIDHIVPRSRGGRTSWSNVVAACHHCNRRKGSKLPKEAGMHLLTKPRKPRWKEMVDDINSGVYDDWLPFLDYGGI